MSEKRCGICNHIILDLHHCGECIDELRSSVAAAEASAEEATRELETYQVEHEGCIDIWRKECTMVHAERDALASRLARAEEAGEAIARVYYEIAAESLPEDYVRSEFKRRMDNVILARVKAALAAGEKEEEK